MSATITKALHEIMSKVSYVQKGQTNSFHKYRYAGEADLLAVLRPAMMEAGLLLIPSAVSQSPIDQYGNTQVVMEYTLAHKDCDVWPHPIRALGCGNDANSKGGVGDKGTYKAITGANKYLLFKLFQIETGDDPEGNEADGNKIEPMGNNRHRDDIGSGDSWREWAMAPKGSDCEKWLKGVKLMLGQATSVEAIDAWMKAAEAAKRIRALHDHHTERFDWLMGLVNDKRDELRAKEAA